MLTTTVTVIIVCTINNFIQSNCVPPEMWQMPVDICIVEGV